MGGFPRIGRAREGEPVDADTEEGLPTKWVLGWRVKFATSSVGRCCC